MFKMSFFSSNKEHTKESTLSPCHPVRVKKSVGKKFAMNLALTAKLESACQHTDVKTD